MRNDKKVNITTIISIISVITISSTACNKLNPVEPQSSPTDTRTLTSTQTILLTSTITPTKSYPEWPIVYMETFDEDYKVWELGEISDDYCKGIISVIDGKYVVNITAGKGLLKIFSEYRKELTNLDISLDVDKSFGSINSSYGLVIKNNNNDSLYYFGIIEETQQYYISKLVNDQWVTIIKPTISLFIIPQLINQIRLLANDTVFTFFINGKIVNQIEENVISSGQAGIGITLQRPGDKILVSFDNLIIREPN